MSVLSIFLDVSLLFLIFLTSAPACSVTLGVCSVLAEVSATGAVSCTTDSSSVVVTGGDTGDEPVDGDEVDGEGIGGSSACRD